ncbi:TetR/AcrR family transcriptional regulator [Mesorhizobium sp. CAU 1741]|uniref:TetR/AcrR family transcriptional regulator n=1 Tax=Mesorhizobium sp. CAU 1741 TaxID=3140366 RepID=UPI00325B7638
MSDKVKGGAREKVIQAAEELAWEAGPNNMSLDAVAARAGVSKGGLLYHFPSKARLLQALVETFVERFDADLAEREREEAHTANSTARAYLDLFLREHDCNLRPPAGVLAALAENPDLLDPVRRHQRILLDRMKQTASDPTVAVIVFLCLQGLKSMELLATDTVDEAEFEAVTKKLAEMLL